MLDLKEERRYTRLRKLAQELHIPMPEAFIMLEVFNKDGKLIQKHKQRSHSWTRNAYNVMFCKLALKDCDDAGLFEAGKLSLKETDTTIRAGAGTGWIDSNKSVDGTTNGYRAVGGDDAHGILVGSGTNAESFEDYVLQTPIAEGAGGGQISHIASEAHDISYDIPTKVLKNDLVRYFNNNTGGNVSVNEVALVSAAQEQTVGAAIDVLAARDLLGATVTIPDTGQLKVTYTIQLTYPV